MLRVSRQVLQREVRVKGHECSSGASGRSSSRQRPPARKTGGAARSGGPRTGSSSRLTQKPGGEWADVSSSRCRPNFRKRSGFCGRGLIGNAVDVGDGGNVGIKTTEWENCKYRGERTPLPHSGLQKTGPPGRKRDRPHLRSQPGSGRAARSAGGPVINPPCGRRSSGDGFA